MAAITEAPRSPTVNSTKLYVGLAVHPGESLREELEARGLSQRAFAAQIARPAQVINEICRGKKAITASTALALERGLDGVSAEFWVRLQADYDLALARLRLEAAPTS